MPLFRWAPVQFTAPRPNKKLSTKSSTESELVGVNDVLPQVMWTRYFLEAQGYGAQDLTVYQDYLSKMMLATNRRASRSKITQQINIRFFFVTDRIRSKEIILQHEPTATMLADFFTKPLQGAAFRDFRDRVLGFGGIQREQIRDINNPTMVRGRRRLLGQSDQFCHRRSALRDECLQNAILPADFKKRK